MKKIILLFSLVGMFGLQSCTVQEDQGVFVDNDTYSEVIERNISFNTTNDYSAVVDLIPAIPNSDVVLVYRLNGIFEGDDVWKLVPESFYFDNGNLDFGYRFDFTRKDVKIYMVGNNLQSVATKYRLNQVFRIVLVPASFATDIDKSNYIEVISALNINEKDIQKIEF